MNEAKIWLDDLRPPPDDSWFHLATVDGVISLLGTMELVPELWVWAEASFDHDLGDGKDAIELCNWMLKNRIFPIKRPAIHSMNPVGRKNMNFVLDQIYEDDEIPL